MLEAKNVVKTFDGFRALDGVSMTVPQGAVYGLVGPNGAGKSTIIRHFTGIYRPDSGEITLDGQPVYENPAVKGRMAAIPDDWYFFPQASIREMARLYAGTHPFFSWDRYHKLREVFPLSEKQPLRRMSKGMQKQAAFWLTMSCMPEVLHRSAVGRVYTYIIRGKREDILHRMQALSPLLLEAIPLTLEEIFIYELGGADYAVREIIL